jgi:hypothetical protein
MSRVRDVLLRSIEYASLTEVEVIVQQLAFGAGLVRACFPSKPCDLANRRCRDHELNPSFCIRDPAPDPRTRRPEGSLQAELSIEAAPAQEELGLAVLSNHRIQIGAIERCIGLRNKFDVASYLKTERVA